MSTFTRRGIQGDEKGKAEVSRRWSQFDNAQEWNGWGEW